MHKQHVLVEFNNTCPFVVEFVSRDEITIEKVAQYYIDNEDFNEDKDALTFVDAPESIRL